MHQFHDKWFKGVVGMFGVSNIRKPNLMFTGEVEEFHPADDEMFSMNGVFKGNGNVEEEIICKVAEDLASFILGYSSLRFLSKTLSLLKGILNIDEKPCDTFVKLEGFTKGFVVVNGFNIGRYFNPAGPQKTLYIPAPLLREGENKIIVFESDALASPSIELKDIPELG